ncbi:hypothetical protein CLAIMM_14478 isoform 2, partial [Cladophialophora immunda]
MGSNRANAPPANSSEDSRDHVYTERWPCQIKSRTFMSVLESSSPHSMYRIPNKQVVAYVEWARRSFGKPHTSISYNSEDHHAGYQMSHSRDREPRGCQTDM